VVIEKRRVMRTASKRVSSTVVKQRRGRSEEAYRDMEDQ
jgi:hypothetical protein